MKLICMIILIFGASACLTGVVPISQREYLHEKEGKSPTLGHRRPIEEKSESRDQIFVKRESLALVPKEAKNYTGSLLSLNKSDNLLFIDPPRGEVGDALDVVVKVNRSDKPKAPEATPAPPAAPGDKPAAGKGPQDELIAALPKLEPSTAEPKIPSTIKMQVVRKLENGDVIVEAARASQNDWETHSIKAQSRISRNRLRSNGEITTADLADVQWYESQNNQITERESTLWEDEYTMRWAGFDEARSKIAIDLENKRKDMQKVKERLQDRIVNLGKERSQIAKERDRVNKLRQEAEQKVSDLAKQVDERQAMIDQQKETIKKQEQLLESQQNAGENPPPAKLKANANATPAESKANEPNP